MNDPRPELESDGAAAFAPVPLGPRRRRLDPGSFIVGLVGLFLVVAIVHPWSGSPAAPVTAPKPTTAPPSEVTTVTPAADSTTVRIPASATEALDRVINGPGGPMGDWGVAVGAGAGPGDGPAFDVTTQVPIISIALDGSWSAWARVNPVVSHPKPSVVTEAVLDMKVADLCAHLPDLPSGAEVVTLTWPGARPANVQVRAWQLVGWHDEPRYIEPLVGIREEPSNDGAGLGYLRQAAGGPLLDGRYEFRVIDAQATTTLSVCIGRP